MTKKIAKLWNEYEQQLKVLRAFSSAEALLSWDREALMPRGAAIDRGETMSVLAGFAHNLMTDKKFVKLVDSLVAEKSALSSIEARSVLLTQRELRKSVRLSSAFVEETNQIVNAGYEAWLQAKKTNDFQIFAPHLEKIIENRKQYAACINPDEHPYNVLLDDYEEGLTIEQLRPVFTELKMGLKKLLPEVLAHQHRAINPFDQMAVDHVQLQAFLTELATKIGFDFNRGLIGHVEHPFEIHVSAHDHRINTHFSKTENSFTIMGFIHELGHGLYEQNVDLQYLPVGLMCGVSLGIHESQSRFLENVVGRSPQFWQYFLPRLKQQVPAFAQVELSQLISALNTVEPSLIRTEADEITYNLHIILRFELEIQLMTGELKVADLPGAWRALMKELLGVEPESDATGVLQDVHWAWGNLGYFPTYTLGNVNAAQLLASFSKANPDWLTEISEGNFSGYFNWFKAHIWQHGCMFTPAEVMKNATGELSNAKYLLKYLQAKYLA